MMGGVGAHEYMAPSAAGENDVALAPGYAANVEIASAEAAAGRAAAPAARAGAGRDARDDHRGRGGRRARRARRRAAQGLSGDHRRRAEARHAARRPPRQRHQAPERARRRVPARAGGGVRGSHRAAPGYIGPVGADVPILLDRGVAPGGYVTGSNRPDSHLRGVEPGRDFPFEPSTSARVEAGDTVNGHPIRIEPAIEVGNIFKLGTRFSEPLGATLPRRVGRRAADLDGLLRHRPGADRRRRRRAVRRRARHQLAALDRAVRRRARRASARRAPRSARSPNGCTTSCARPGSTSSTTTATPARARSSPTPSCSACRCGSPSAGARSRPARSRRSCGAAAWRPSVPLDGAADAAADLWRSLP